ncbi:MAG: response regulator transcription factor [Verrucomicrobia bacterium]|nr:response regulator transcription factor [Verrucomicrobiota bacterium]
MKVLLIENDPISRLYMEASLATLGLVSEIAESGEEARHILGGNADIRLIVCDWMMADQTGLELCRWVRARKMEYVYFILYTPHDSSKENEDAAIDAGVDDFLQKPVNLRDLRIRLHVARRILDSAAHIRELQQLVPICSYCKSVREDEDYWQRIEQYVSARTGSEFTHSVCPTCYEQHIIPQFVAMNITPPPRTKPQARAVRTGFQAGT